MTLILGLSYCQWKDLEMVVSKGWVVRDLKAQKTFLGLFNYTRFSGNNK